MLNLFFELFFIFCHSILIIICMLLNVAFYTLLERKLLADIHRRNGPTISGFFGLLQPMSDGLKLILKERFIPSSAQYFFFYISPIWLFTFSFTAWAVLPFNFTSFLVNFRYGVLIILAISGFGILGIIIAGWASNSRYALLGALRSAAQLISYEISLGLTVLPIVLWSNSFNFLDIVFAQKNIFLVKFIMPMLPLFLIFFISALAESNRAPFDLPEAEAELVAGFNVEYSSTPFALFFLAEYGNLLLLASTISILYLGGWTAIGYFFVTDSIFCLVIRELLVAILFIIIRSIMPRFRYDQLMEICWKRFLPLCFAFFHFTLFVRFFATQFSINNFEISTYLRYGNSDLVMFLRYLNVLDAVAFLKLFCIKANFCKLLYFFISVLSFFFKYKAFYILICLHLLIYYLLLNYYGIFFIFYAFLKAFYIKSNIKLHEWFSIFCHNVIKLAIFLWGIIIIDEKHW